MKKLFSYTLPLLLLLSISVSVIASAQTTLPDCVKKLNPTQVPGDTNKYYYTDPQHGQVFLYISNKRYGINTTGQIGDWACGTNGSIVLIGVRTPTNTADSGTDTANHTVDDGKDSPGTLGSGTQTTNLPLKIQLHNPLKVDTVQDAIKLFMDAVIKIAIPFIVVFFIWAGLQFILAQGNSEKLKKAKMMFWYTIIGTLLILGAWAITDAIVGTVNSIAS